MPSLSYSSAALDTLASFHKVKFVIFVEGIEDIAFWDCVFKEVGLTSYHLKPAGGAEEIEKYTQSILSDNADIAVARDCDLLDLLQRKHLHPRILYTYGYSIENSICNATGISKTLQNLICTTDNFTQEAAFWMATLSSELLPLLRIDIANHFFRKGLKVPLTNFERFSHPRDKTRVCPIKVQHAATSLQASLSPQEHAHATTTLSASLKPLNTHLRGHFLMSAVSYFVRGIYRTKRGKTVSLSNEALFALLMGQFSLISIPTAEKAHYVDQTQQLKNAA